MAETDKSQFSLTERVLVLVAKWPMLGTSKTRLIPALGPQGAFRFAQLMLQDLLTWLSKETALNDVHRVLYFAPKEKESEVEMFLNEHEATAWITCPMIEDQHLTSSDLTEKLKFVLSWVRERFGNCSVCFIGMDTPHLAVESILEGYSTANNGDAYICPATDGGYVLLTLPPGASPAVFENIRWSTSCTLHDQTQAILMSGTQVVEGSTYTDVDTIDDVNVFIKITSINTEQATSKNCSACTSFLLQFPTVNDFFASTEGVDNYEY